MTPTIRDDGYDGGREATQPRGTIPNSLGQSGGAGARLEGKAQFPEVDERQDPMGDPPMPSYGW